eukprot:354256-Chlamydomonas_euryale.AAC.2
MPALDMLLPGHGARAPVRRLPHQHVGRHVWEGTFRRGLTGKKFSDDDDDDFTTATPSNSKFNDDD